MRNRAASALRELSRRKTEYRNGAGRRKCELLRALETRRLRRAADVHLLHETLCFLRAYPDDALVLAQVERMLDAFADRKDLRRHRRALANTGIAGTSMQFSFFAPTALWLARRCGARLTIDWPQFEHHERLESLLPLLALDCEMPGLDEYAFDAREWIERMKAPDETDAAFLLRRFGQVRMSPVARETLLDELDLPLRLGPGPDTPARTREKYPAVPVAYQRRPLSRARPAMPGAVAKPPLSIRLLSPRRGQTLIDLARSAMASRCRDLDAFAYGTKHDVRLVDCGDGLVFAYIGVIPERRLLLETLYGFLALKNGVPVGYGTTTVLFGSAEVAYTVFDTYRSAEAAAIFARVLSIAHHVFQVDTFMIEPYQLGQDNDDALRSGAWWFYYKMGFRPRDAGARRIMRRELRRMKSNPKHRSSIRTLTKLADSRVFLHLKKPRDDVLGVLPLANVGLHVTRYLAQRFGFDRRKAARSCSQEAAGLLGLRSLREFSTPERLAWNRWAPLVMALPGIQRWPVRDKRALIDVVRAKGGRCEVEYQLRFDRHRRLRESIRTLTRG